MLACIQHSRSLIMMKQSPSGIHATTFTLQPAAEFTLQLLLHSIHAAEFLLWGEGVGLTGVSGLVGVNVMHVYIQERGTGQWNKTGSCIDWAGILGKNWSPSGQKTVFWRKCSGSVQEIRSYGPTFSTWANQTDSDIKFSLQLQLDYHFKRGGRQLKAVHRVKARPPIGEHACAFPLCLSREFLMTVEG